MSGFTEIDVPETLRIETEATTAPDTPDDDAPRPLSKRELDMAAIAERRKEAIERELSFGVTMEDEARAAGGGEPHDRDESPRPIEDIPDASSHTAPSPSTTSPTPTADQTYEPRRHTINVGGQVFHVTDAELQHLASVGAVATVAMQQQQHAQQPQPSAPPRHVEVAPTPASHETMEPARVDRTKLAETWRKMSFGTEEDGVAALQELISTVAAPRAPDPSQIAQQVHHQLRQEQQLESTLIRVGRDYQDVFGPMDRTWTPEEASVFTMRGQAAALALDSIRRRDAMMGVQRADEAAYREAADMVRRSLLPGQQPQDAARQQTPAQAAPPSVAPQGERIERKRAAPRQPSAVGRTAGSGGETQQSRAPTPSEVVAWMAQRRNQQSPVRTT